MRRRRYAHNVGAYIGINVVSTSRPNNGSAVNVPMPTECDLASHISDLASHISQIFLTQIIYSISVKNK